MKKMNFEYELIMNSNNVIIVTMTISLNYKEILNKNIKIYRFKLS